MCNIEYIAFATGVLVFISEVLPFISRLESNGIVHAIVCILKSDCFKIKDNDTNSDISTDPSTDATDITEEETTTIEMTEVYLSDTSEVSSEEYMDY